MFSVFDDIVSNAIGVEVHNRNKVGYKPDPTLNAVYVLIGAFNDGKYIVPVKLEIKEFNDKENVLYVAVALEKVKATEVSGQGNTNNGVTQNSRSVANISLAQLFRKINPNDKEFVKYIPDEFLENKQIEAKAQTLFEESKRLVREKPLVQKNSDSGKEFNDPNGRYSKDDTIFDDFEDEVVFSEGGVSYEIKYQLFTEKDYYNNSLKLQKMNAVEELTGEEFSYDGTPLNKRVLRYFRELGNNIYSDVFGDVALNNSSVHDDLGHGKTKYKIASFKAVPAVIKKGVVIDRVY